MNDLSLEDAATLLTGADMSSTRTLADAPRLVLSDGPSGLAMNLPDLSGKIPATAFPAPVALAATWDTALVHEVARAIGTEARSAGADVLLGPSINIKRSPLGGRNFEYYSEDPQLTGHLAAAFVRGVQSAGVGACLKHFAVNSQETDRMRVSAEVDDTTLREIYLPAFERAVKDAAPAMVMASYNRINGVYAAQHRWLLTQVLRDEWGFEGAVVSDWGAVDDPVASVAAGLDLQMPGPADSAREDILGAVADGRLHRSDVIDAAERLRAVARRWSGGPTTVTEQAFDPARHGDLARRAAAESFVLLRNAEAALPLPTDGSRILVVGELADSPTIQGGGSAHVEAGAADSPLAALRHARRGTTEFERGYVLDGPASEELADAAVQRAAGATAVVVVVGTGRETDSEGYDRTTLDLPADQVRLVQRLAEVNPRTVVVINTGGVVTMERWRHKVAAILHVWLPGGAGGSAVADVLLGAVSPSGKLPETFPLALRDTPTWTSFPGRHGRALHGEGVFVGYRWYDHADIAVAYPFGHGLSYTTFDYRDLTAVITGAHTVECSFVLTNAGPRAGAEVWQAYVRPPRTVRDAPPRSLAAFGKVSLLASERSTVRFTLDRRAFATWDESVDDWKVEDGRFTIEVGASSRDVRASVGIDLAGTARVAAPRRGSTLREWVTHPDVGPLLLAAVQERDETGGTTGFLTDPTVLTMIGDMPIERLHGDPGNVLDQELLDEVLERAAVSPGR